MRLLVTGRGGQVVRSLAEAAASDPAIEFVLAARPELDLARPETVAPAIAAARPDLVVSAAAYTAVDRAESEPQAAFAINCEGAGEVARAAAASGAPVIHISTDYVFSGDKQTAYVETDPTGPTGVYGRSKLEGERLVAAANPAHAILRTAWVYSPYGHNFARTMLRLARDRDVVRVVADQLGTPTYAPHIAEGILAVARRMLAEADDPRWRGVFHMVARGHTSWAGFAEEIFRQSGMLAGPSARVEPITTADYPTPAKRPANSRLNTDKFATVFGLALPDWQVGVKDFVGASMCALETNGPG